MLKPTEDKVLRQSLLYQAVKFTDNLKNAELLVDDFLQAIELVRYHKGLPPNTREALPISNETIMCPQCHNCKLKLIEQPRKYKHSHRHNKLIYRYYWCFLCGYTENLPSIRR